MSHESDTNADAVRAVKELLADNQLGYFSAVSSDSRPWSWCAFFAFSESWRLFLLSDPGARHAQYLRDNPWCAATIADSGQKLGMTRKGLQMEGTCRLTTSDDLTEALELYRARFPLFADALQSEQSFAGAGWASKFWTFKPSMVQVFHEDLLGIEHNPVTFNRTEEAL